VTVVQMPGAAERSRTVGIVGGGKVGHQLLLLFADSRLTTVVYVVDTNPGAPGVAAARERGIAVFDDVRAATTSTRADFVFEVTGSKKVVAICREALANQPTELVTHDMAHVLLRVIDEGRRHTTSLVTAEMLEVKNEMADSLKRIGGASGAIRRTANALQMLAINARLEAARAGDQGQGFDVVAQEVQHSAESVKQMTQDIETVNEKMRLVADRIELALGRLK
jgi:hypothetical protein